MTTLPAVRARMLCSREDAVRDQPLILTSTIRPPFFTARKARIIEL
jgi:hypothetical protein